MLIVSSGEFRANQKAYLDKVDDGQEVLIQRGKDKSYRIVPVMGTDTVLRAEDFAKEPDEDLEQAISFDEVLEHVHAHIHELFKNKKECAL